MLAISLITTSCLFGLLFLWAAKSQQHWFLRGAVVAAALASLLVIPAYELFVCIGVHSLVVTTVVAPKPQRFFVAKRFSLATLLLLTAVVANLVAVFVRLPEHGWAAWLIVVGVGIQAGLHTLLGAWIALGRGKYWWRLAVALLTSAASLLTLLFVIHKSVATPWQPPSPFGESIGHLLDFRVIRTAVAWRRLGLLAPTFGVSMAIVLLTALLAHLGWRGHGSFRRVVTIASVIAMAALPALLFSKMVRPTPIPMIPRLATNGYTALTEAGRQFDSPILNDWAAATPTALRGEIAKYQSAYQLARMGLSQECCVPVEYSRADWRRGETHGMRNIARAFGAEAHVARVDGQFGRAALCYADAVRLGAAMSGGGLVIDALVGKAVEGVGLGGLSEIGGGLSSSELETVINVLQSVDSSWDRTEQMILRDRAWSEHAVGWQARLENSMAELSGVVLHASFQRIMSETEAKRHLLMVELAIRAYQLDEGRLPDSLTDLVGRYLPMVPRDPFKEGPLGYRRIEDGYLLYSVGPDGIDDGGERLTKEELFSDKRGDVSLQTYFGDVMYERANWRDVPQDGTDYPGSDTNP